MIATIQKIATWGLDFLFPKQCLLCERYGEHVCNECLARLPISLPHPSPWITARYQYSDPDVSSLIVRLKSFPDKTLAHLFAEQLYENVYEVMSNANLFGHIPSRIIICPIPIDYRRFRERGFNQSALIARALVRLIPESEYRDILKKTRHTQKQALLYRKQDRLENVRSVFSLNDSEVVSDSTILLIDDISTTGATLADAKRAILQGGAKKVFGFVVAHS